MLAIAFHSKVLKPDFHHRYRDANRRACLAGRTLLHAERTALVHTSKIGDIVNTCWGYDPNIEFFEIDDHGEDRHGALDRARHGGTRLYDRPPRPAKRRFHRQADHPPRRSVRHTNRPRPPRLEMEHSGKFMAMLSWARRSRFGELTAQPAGSIHVG